MKVSQEQWDQLKDAVNDDMFIMAVETVKHDEKMQLNQYVKNHWDQIKENDSLKEILSIAMQKISDAKFSSFTQQQAKMIMPKAYKIWKKQIPNFSEMINEPLVHDLLKVIKNFEVMKVIKSTIEGDLNDD